MSFRTETNDPIIGKMRKGTPDDPYKGIIETLQIINGAAQLTEIPNRLEKVIVTGLLYPMYEVTNGELSENTYQVDYTQGVVHFHSNINGQFLVFKYMGRGAHFFPATRIYLGYDTEYNTAEKKFKDIDREIVNQRNRVNTLLVENPQPSEVVDIRVDRNGKVYRVAKERVDATQKTVEDAFVDLTDHQFGSLKERVDSEQKKIEETYFGDDGSSYFSMRDRFDHTDLRVKRTVITATRLSEITNFKEGDLVHTLGFYKAGDGGSATYEITGDRITADGNTIISLYGNLKARLIVDREINVKQLGAKGDGVNPDAPLIQKALDMALTIPNIKVNIPAGTYNLTHELYIRDASYFSAHPRAILKRNHNGNILRNYWQDYPNGGYGGVSNFTIEGGIFDCNGAVYTSIANGISLAHGTNITIRDITIKDVPKGHALELAAVQDVIVENSTFKGFRDETEERLYSEAIQVETASPANGGMYNADYTPARRVTVRDCIFDESETPGFGGFPTAVGAHGATFGKFYDDIIVTNNKIRKAFYAGVRPFKFRNSIISQNLIENGNRGIYVVVAAGGASITDPEGNTRYPEPTENITITENIIKNMTGSGIFIEGKENAEIGRLQIANNTVVNVKGYGISAEYINRSNFNNNILDTVADNTLLIKYASHSQINHNQLYNGSKNGIFILESQFVDIEVNKIRNMGFYGINISGTNKYLFVEMNKIYSVSQNSPGSYDGILVTSEARDIYIQRNILRTETGFQRSRHAINIQSGTDRVMEYDNDTRMNSINIGLQDYSSRTILWDGASYMASTAVITPNKRLSSCRNGWILVWSDYDPGTGANNYNFAYSFIPREIIKMHEGKQHFFDILSGFSPNSISMAGKSLSIYDDKLTGSVLNGYSPESGQYSKDVCLRYVLEF